MKTVEPYAQARHKLHRHREDANDPLLHRQLEHFLHVLVQVLNPFHSSGTEFVFGQVLIRLLHQVMLESK